ncbi:M28 family peptidase [Ichthyenterobacterium sp. W332]|uniref:M28 family peptidase n=1 Tax=Microcosmobacter mediterraneus TaxID=3075607 RepID=A0ABU2YHI3_9FLAO|nr:M28 family peptidase [Ichthyenterobacterium sp. W332]MDT0557631.1 M28 family peptidase [Ichthyenterobacterium sp. W332]
MKKSPFFIGAMLLLVACGSSNNKTVSNTEVETKAEVNPVKYANTITQNEIKEMLYIYASDEFEGRLTGAPGQKKAVEYLKNQYTSMGIGSAYNNDDYFQEVPLEKQQVAKSTLSVNGTNFKPFENQFCISGGKTGTMQANEVVYVGFGVETDSYSDYGDIDVKGKVVLMKAGEAKNEDGTYVTSGDIQPTKWTNPRQAMASKRNVAKDKGAIAVILMDDTMYGPYSGYFSRMAESGTSGRMSLKSNDVSIPMFMVNKTFATNLHPTISEDNSVKSIPTDFKVAIESKSENLESENVVAFIKGSEKPDEVLVISAHLDHEGVKNGEVYNGADDDGSGTIAIVEIAEAFKTAINDGYKPKRSILFLHVTGEEKGLLGSRYYTDMDPIFPLENTIANLNIDMIGRIDPKRKSNNRNYVYLIGSDKLSTELHNISEEINAKYCNIELDYTYNDENDPNRYYYRSDHYNFAKNNIPVIFYFNGTHDDYHKPTDTPDKIEYDLLENRARLVFYTAWELANRDARIIVDKAE